MWYVELLVVIFGVLIIHSIIIINVFSVLEIGVTDFIKSRFEELTAIHCAIETRHNGSNKTALQLLPRYLRRRAASHNIKRLPRRVRELALMQVYFTIILLKV